MLGPEGAGLGHEHLQLSIVQVETKHTVLDGCAVSWVEDVAHDLALAEASIGHISMDLTIDVVGETDEELSTSESVDLVIDPLFSEGVIYDALCLSGLVESLSELEEIRVPVEVSPHDLSVVGVVATSEALLTSIVEEGDTSCGQCESKCALEESLV